MDEFKIFIFFLLFFHLVFSVNYFISCEGNDSNDGMLKDSAWKTISFLNSKLSKKIASEEWNVFFRTGCIFNDTSIVLSSVSNVSFTSYEQDENNPKSQPIFDTSIIADNTKWKKYTLNSQKNIFYYEIDGNSNYEVTHVYMDEKTKFNMTHYPRNSHENYFQMPSAQDESFPMEIYYPESFDSLLNSSNSESNGDIIGSDIVIRSSRWSFHKTSISSFDRVKKTLTFKDKCSYSPFSKNFGFFLMNKFWMLSPGMFYFNFSSNPSNLKSRIYICLDNGDFPSNHEIRYHQINQILNSITIQSSSKSLKFSQMHIRRSIESGISISSNSKDISFSDSTIEDSGLYGISSSGANCSFSRNLISNSSYNGANLNNYFLFDENKVLDTNIFGCLNLRFSGNNIIGSCININCYNGKCIINRNRIDKCGYHGIAPYGTNSSITHNFVSNACLVADDCGIIYFWGTYTGYHHIEGNLLINASGNSYGTDSYPSKTYDGPGNGIYPDDGTHDSIIINNIISSVQWGIQVHNSRNNTIKNNLVYNARSQGFMISEDTCLNQSGYMIGNEVTNNIFHTKSDSYVFSASGGLDLAHFFKKLDNNVYYPFKMFASSKKTGSITATDLSSWQQKAPSILGLKVDSLSSTMMPEEKYEVHYSKVVQNGPSLIYNGDFEKNVSGWGSWSAISNNVKVTFNSNFSCLQTDVSDKSLSNTLCAISPIFELEKNENYAIDFDAWIAITNLSQNFGDFNISAQTDTFPFTVRKGDSDYASLGLSSSVELSSKKKNFIKSFTANLNYTKARIDFYSSTKDFNVRLSYMIDNVKLYKANTKTYNVTNFSFFYNEDFDEKKVVFLKNQYCDPVTGDPFTQDVSLDPLQGILVLNCYCNNDGVCDNKENANSCPQDQCEAICGNGICETISETTLNCPQDCVNKQALSIALVSLLITFFSFFFFLSFLSVILVSFFLCKKRGKPQEESVEMKTKN